LLAFRICARLDLKSGFLVKGIKFEGLRKLGNVWDFANSYAQEGADEIVIVDVVATLFERASLYDLIHKVSTELKIPLTVIGGIKTIDDAKKLFDTGADKIGINSAGLQRPEIYEEIASIYGSQAVVASIEAKKIQKGYECFYRNGRERSGILIEDWIKRLNDSGCGEIMISSVDRDGTFNGPDLELLRLIRSNTELPVVFGSGVRSPEDVIEIAMGGADSVAIASSLHYKKTNIEEVKSILNNRLIPVRTVST